jgi:hypothetical protein
VLVQVKATVVKASDTPRRCSFCGKLLAAGDLVASPLTDEPPPGVEVLHARICGKCVHDAAAKLAPIEGRRRSRTSKATKSLADRCRESGLDTFAGRVETKPKPEVGKVCPNCLRDYRGVEMPSECPCGERLAL